MTMCILPGFDFLSIPLLSVSFLSNEIAENAGMILIKLVIGNIWV